MATVTSAGVVTAVKAGTATITCTAKDGSGVKATCEVTVEEPIQLVTGITLNKTSAELKVGETASLTATVSPANATNKEVSWTTSDSSVATVTSSGVVTAIKAGTATITCTAKDGSGVKATCQVTVEKEEEETNPIQLVTQIVLSQTTATLVIGENTTLTAYIAPTGATNKTVEWNTSDSSIATVDKDGKISAIKAGTAIITCSTTDGSELIATCTVTVTDQSTPTNPEKPDPSDDDDNNGNEAPSENDDGTGNKTPSDDDNGKGNGNNIVNEEPEEINDDSSDDEEELEEGDAFTDTNTGADYEITNKDEKGGTVEYIEPSKSAKTIEIPDTIEVNGLTYKVTSIQAGAFEDNKKLTKIIIGSNVTSIGEYAFSGCTKLTTVAIGKNVTKIGAKAFYKCTKLKQITIPSKVNYIGKQAFYGCKKLKSITIKTQKLTSKKTGKWAFKGIYSKATVKVPKSKLKTYKKLLKSKGVGSKAKYKKL